MKTSEKIDIISPAILAAQKEIGAASKSANNPFFKSKYADFSTVIQAVKEPLNNNGISYMQLVQHDEAGDLVETVLLHESGQFITTETRAYCKKKDDPQALGSGITYAKRYALQAITGLPTEDDDGNGAAKAPPAPKTPAKPIRIKATESQQKHLGSVFELLSKDVPDKTLDKAKYADAVWILLGKKWPVSEADETKMAMELNANDFIKGM